MPRNGLNQQAVMEAALRIADQHGLEQLTLAALAQQLNVRPPALYNHVHGLTDLRDKLMIYGLRQLTDRLARAAVGKSQDDAVWAAAGTYLVFAREHPGLYEATQRPPHCEGEDVKAAAESFVDIIFRIISPYGLEQENSVHIVRGLRSLLHGFVSLERQKGFGMPTDVDESFRVLIRTFLAGVHAKYLPVT